MVESGNISNRSKTESLTNGHAAAADSPLGKLGSEPNGNVEAVVRPVKYKQRKVSAVRDFPVGCGRFAPRINVRNKDNPAAAVGNLAAKVGSAGVSAGADDSELLSSLDPQIMALSKSSDQVEFLNLPEASVPGTVEVLNGPDDRKLVETSESMVSLPQVKSKEPLKSLTPETVESPRSLDQPELLESGGQPEQMEMLSTSGQVEYLQYPKVSVCPSPSELLRVAEETQLSVFVSEPVEEHLCKKYPPRRKISAVRDFPPGCGRDALPISEERCVKMASPGSKSADNKKEAGHDSSLNRMGITVSSEVADGKLRGSGNKEVRKKTQAVDGIRSESKGGVREEIDDKLLVKSDRNSDTFGDGAREDRAASGSKSKVEDSKEITREFQIRTGLETASVSKVKGESSKEITGVAQIRTARETASSRKTKGKDLNEITGGVQIRTTHERTSGSTSRGEGSREMMGEVQIRAIHERASSTKLEGETKEITEEVQIRASREAAFKSKSEGEHAKEITEKIQIKAARERAFVSKSGTKEITEELKNRASHVSKLSRIDTKSQSASKMSDREVGSSEWKAGKEMVKESKDMSSKRKLIGGLEEKNTVVNQSQQEETASMEFAGDRMIVQALMAAPNCPWRQGKQGKRLSKNSLSSPSSLGRNKQAPGPKKKEDGRSPRNSESSEGRMGSKKSPPARGGASQRNKANIYSVEDPLLYDGEEDDENVSTGQEFSLSVIPFGLPSSNDKGARNKVRETLRLFQAIYRKLLQEEETKPKVQGQSGGRIDLAAYTLLKQKNKCVNTGGVILGSVPGVEVGDEFHYRAELAVIGLHRHLQGGIEYTKREGMIVATSIVASGGYEDEMDSTDVLTYSGQGGNPAGKDKQPEDQKLERGNLALKNSIDTKTPVRVIRGFKEAKARDTQGARGKIISTFVYDGLYLVEKYWQQKSDHGFLVFKFRLGRIPGQPELALKEVKKSTKFKVREGVCVADISGGKEKMPICAVNTLNDERPPPFNYITKMIYPSWSDPIPPKGCDCTGGCLDSEKCFCAVKNGGEIPFNYDGAIVEAKPLVYECGPSCKCPPSCHNRVSQHGIKIQLEIFKTESRGWGVRSLASIPSGSFICEYTGELLQDTEAEQRTGNDEYLFDIGHNYNDRSLWDGLSNLIPELQSNAVCEIVEDVGFTIDAVQYGNVGRFINHSCSPNLYAQNVLYDHGDKRMPRIMFFAAENIPPLQELTYHYNYTIDQVRDANGIIKKKDCYCGSHECTGRLY